MTDLCILPFYSWACFTLLTNIHVLSHPLLNAIIHAIGFLHNGPLVHSFGRSPSRQMASADQFSLSVIVYLSTCLLVSLVFQSLVS